MGAANMVTIQCIYVVFLVGVVVIFVILLYVKMKMATIIYLLNLAIADELFTLNLPFMACWLPHWPFGLTQGVLSMDGLNMFISVFCLNAQIGPTLLRATYQQSSMAKLINLGVWLSSLLVTLTIAIFLDARPAQSSLALAWYLHWSHSAWCVVFMVYTFLLGLLLLGLAISHELLIMYKMMAVALQAGWKQQKCSEKNTWPVLMVAVFVLCWMPFYMVHLLKVDQSDATINHISLILCYVNSYASPIFYGFFPDNFCHSF
ncbi:LOW QUALITY PROTEIN: somatostatin receptor type 4 [Glossophaga mutica]